MIRKNNKRVLYESIMRDVAKTVTKRLNENVNKCGVCSSFDDDDVIEASFKGNDYIVSRHAFAGGIFGGSGDLCFAKLVDDPDELYIVKLGRSDKILELFDPEAWSYGHKVENYYCPACGKKLR